MELYKNKLVSLMQGKPAFFFLSSGKAEEHGLLKMPE
jgi:hypothetical protein